MRMESSNWSWASTLACCFAVSILAGCKTGPQIPGADWLSWGKPQPTSGSLTRPSAGQLPTPSETTAGPTAVASNAGAGTYDQSGGATSHAAHGSHSRNATTHAGLGSTPYSTSGANYQTGPYNTGSSTGSYPATSGLATSETPASSGPYHSPYHNPQHVEAEVSQGSVYSTADARNSSTYGAEPSAPQTWDSQQWSQGAANTTPNSTEPAAPQGTQGGYPETQSPYASGGQQPASYQQPQPAESSRGNAPQSWSSGSSEQAYPTTSGAYDSGLNGSTSGAGASTAGITTHNSGQYRPGTTGRNSAVLGQSSGTTANSSPANSYPSTSTPAATANQSWSYGTPSQYPSTGQY